MDKPFVSANTRLYEADEPLLGLSPMMQKAVVDTIVTLNRETGLTVLLSEQFARPDLPIVNRADVVENG